MLRGGKNSVKRRRGPATGHQAELLSQPYFYCVDREGVKTDVKLHSRQGTALLAYLHVRGEGVSRERLIDLLWHEENGESARNSFRVLLSKLKKRLPNVLTVTTKSISLVPGSVLWDTDHFNDLLERGSVTSLTEAALLYRGGFMQDFTLEASDDFENWLDGERETWRGRYNTLMRKLVDLLLAQGRGSKALPLIERWRNLDPESEAAHRQQMWLSWKEGNSEPALALYRRLVKKLQTDLGIGPEESTQDLYRAILQSLDRDQALAAAIPVPGVTNRRLAAGDVPESIDVVPAVDPSVLYHSNLELTSFVGRDLELEQLQNAVKRHRLVTVQGLGGVGKTRLMLEASRNLAEHFSGGVTIVICEQLDVAGLARHLSELTTNFQKISEPLLIVLDSFDALQSQQARVLQLFKVLPSASVLLTSREPLGILGERVFGLLPLPYPSAADLKDPEQLVSSPAVELFWERAYFESLPTAVERGSGTQALVLAARISRAMSGLPLGVEIAASQVAHTALSDLADAAERAPHLLKAEHRTAARHESLATVALDTWTRLTPSQQQALTRLTDISEPFLHYEAGARANLEVRELQQLTRKGFLIPCPSGCYSFPYPFRLFTANAAKTAVRK